MSVGKFLMFENETITKHLNCADGITCGIVKAKWLTSRSIKEIILLIPLIAILPY